MSFNEKIAARVKEREAAKKDADAEIKAQNDQVTEIYKHQIERLKALAPTGVQPKVSTLEESSTPFVRFESAGVACVLECQGLNLIVVVNGKSIFATAIDGEEVNREAVEAVLVDVIADLVESGEATLEKKKPATV